MEQLVTSLEVHYVHPNGTHSNATVTHIHNKERGVVNLHIVRDDHIKEEYNAPTVVFREVPVAYTWHFISDQCPPAGEPQPAQSN